MDEHKKDIEDMIMSLCKQGFAGILNELTAEVAIFRRSLRTILVCSNKERYIYKR